MTEHPPGTIIVVSDDLSRYTAFTMAFLAVQKPIGSVSQWVTSVNVARNLNEGIAHMRGEWVWLMGDDHVFAPDTLMRLLAHNIPVVGPLCLHRKPPCEPIVYRSQSADGKFHYWPRTELPGTGMVRVAGTSGAGLLVRKLVLDAVGAPWFRHGRLDEEDISEDLDFQQRVREAGFAIYTDLDTWIGHIGPGAIWPLWTSDGWQAAVDMDCRIPQITQEA